MEPVWWLTKDGDRDCLAIYERHYSAYHYADGRERVLFIGPGEKWPFRTWAADALFVWRKFIDDCIDPRTGERQSGVNCAVFRNEGTHRSSDLIREEPAQRTTEWYERKAAAEEGHDVTAGVAESREEPAPQQQLDLEPIRQRVKKATKGPWFAWRASTDFVGWTVQIAAGWLFKASDKCGEYDAEFIAHARDDVPALLAEIDRLCSVAAATPEEPATHD